MKQQKLQRLKDFLKDRRKTKKIQTTQAKEIDELKAFIDADNVQQFRQHLQKNTKEFFLAFLTNSDLYLESNLEKIIKKINRNAFIKVINEWSLSNLSFLQERLLRTEQRQWQIQFLNVNRQLCKCLTIELKKEESKSQITLLVQFLSQAKGFFSILYQKHLKIDFIQLLNIDEKQLKILLKQFIIPLSTAIQKSEPSYKGKQNLVKIYQQLSFEDAWKFNKYKEYLEYQQFLTLKEVNYNFMHELFEKKQYDQAIKLFQYMIQVAIEDHKTSDLVQNCMNKFNSSNQTPLDICLGKAQYENIIKVFDFVKKYDQICLSTHCLSKLLANKHLRKHKQLLIPLLNQCLNGSIADRGYLQRTYHQYVKTFKHQTGQKSTYTYNKIFKQYEDRFIIIFDKQFVLLDKDSSGSFPLLSLLTLYKDNLNLQEITLLFPQLLSRKNMKKKYFALLKIYGVQNACVNGQSKSAKAIQDITYYQQGLLSYLPMINNQEIIKFFFQKMFINHFFIKNSAYTFIENSTNFMGYESIIGQHFILQYCKRAKNLSENTVNKLLLNKIFESKESQQIYGDYNLFKQLKKNYESNHQFFSKQQWLIKEISSRISMYKYLENPEKSFNGENDKVQIQKQQAQKIKINKNIVYQTVRKISGTKTLEQLAKLAKILEQNLKKPSQYILFGQQQTDLYEYYNKPNLYSTDDLFEQKMIACIQNNIQVKIFVTNPLVPYPIFRNPIYKDIFLQLLQTGKQLYQILLFSKKQMPQKNLIKIVEGLGKNYIYRIIKNAVSKLYSLGDVRFRSFPLLNKMVSILNLKIDDDEDGRFKLLLSFFFLKDVQLILRKIQNEQDLSVRIALWKELDTYLFNNFLHCEILLTQKNKKQSRFFIFSKKQTKNLCAHTLINQPLSIRDISDAKYSSTYYFHRIYPILLKILSQTNDMKDFLSATNYQDNSKLYNFNPLPNFFKMLNDKAAYTLLSASGLLFNLRLNSFNQRKKLIIEYLQQPYKNNQQQDNQLSKYQLERIHLFPELYDKILELKISDYIQIVQMISSSEFHFKFIQKCKDQDMIIQHCKSLSANINFTNQIVIKAKLNPMKLKLVALATLTLMTNRKENAKETYVFIQQKGQQKQKKYNLQTVWFKSNQQTFQNFLQVFKEFTDNEEEKIKLGKIIISWLFHSQSYYKLTRLLEQNIQKDYLSQTLDLIYSMTRQTLQKNKKLNEFVKLTNLIFKKFGRSQWNQIDFTRLYLLDFKNAFNVFKHYETISVENALKCLQTYPEGATLWRKYKIKIEGESMNRKKHIVPYQYDQIDRKPWLLDLLILNLSICPNNHKKWVPNVFLHQKAFPYYRQLKINENIDFFALKALKTTNLKSAKNLPNQLREKMYKIVQLVKLYSCLNSQLIKQCILGRHIEATQEEIWKIIQTSNMDVIRCYIKTYPQTNFSDRNVLSKLNESPRVGKRGFLGYLLNFSSQKFIIEFLKHYEIFKNYPKDFYTQTSKTVLHYICLKKQTCVLQYYIDYCKNTLKLSKLVFHAGQSAKASKQGIFELPIQLAIQSNFYQYYFLCKSSGNTSPAFQYSDRFLFQSNLEKYNCIPELKKRLQILGSIIKATKRQKSYDTYIYYFTLVFETQQLFTQKKQEKSLSNLLRYICDGKPQNDRVQGNYQRLSYLLKIHQLLIPKEILKQLFSFEYQMVSSLLKFTKNQELYFDFDSVFEHKQLKGKLLTYQPKLFLEKFAEQLMVFEIQNLTYYAEGVFVNLVLLEKEYFQTVLKQFFGMNYQKQGYFEVLKHEEDEGKVAFQPLIDSKKGNQIYNQILLKSMIYGNKKTCCFLLDLLQKQYSHQELISFILNKFYFDDPGYRGINTFFISSLYENFERSQQIVPSSKRITQAEITSLLKATIICIKQLSQTQNIELVNLEILQRQLKLRINNLYNSNGKPYQIYLACIFSYYCIKTDFTNIDMKISRNSNYKQKIENKKLIIKQKTNGKYKVIQESTLQLEVGIEHTQIKNLNLIHFDFNESLALVTFDQILYDHQIEGQISFLNQQQEYQFDVQNLHSIQYKAQLEDQFFKVMSLKFIQSFKQDSLTLVEPQIEITVYSFDNICGPVAIGSQAGQLATQCCSLYEFIELNNVYEPLSFLHEKPPKIEQQNAIIMNDLQKYFTYLKQEVQGEHKEYLTFSKAITFSLTKQKIEIESHKFSKMNILKCMAIFRKIRFELERKYNLFETKLNIAVSIKSLLIVLKQTNKSSKKLLFEQIKQFFYHPKHYQIVHKILFMILEEQNLMSNIKHILIKHKIASEKTENVFPINEKISVSKLGYDLKNQLLIITIELFIQNNFKKSQSCEVPLNLISRKQLLQSIYGTIENLTNFLIDKNEITAHCLRLSRELSKNINSHLNIVVDYKSLYIYIVEFLNKTTVIQVVFLLKNLKTLIINNFEETLKNYFSNKTMPLKFKIKLFNKMLSLKKKVPLRDIQSNFNNTLIYKYNDFYHKDLEEIRFNIRYQIKDSINLIKNKFLVQIYRNSFASIVTQGMTFIFGQKQGSRIITFKNNEDINTISIIQTRYILLVSNSLPTENQLERSKIVKIFIYDLDDRCYKIQEELAEYLLTNENQQRSIAQLVPIIPPNICLHFPNQYLNSSSSLQDSNEFKIIEIALKQERELKIKPKQQKSISILELMKAQKFSHEQFFGILENYFNKELELFVVCPSVQRFQQYQYIKLLKDILTNIGSMIQHYMKKFAYNTNLQLRLCENKTYNALDNFYVLRRREIFEKYFKGFRIQFNNQKNNCVFIDDNFIVIQAHLSKNYEDICDQNIQYTILQFLIQKQKQSYVKIINYDNISRSTLIKYLDCILSMEYQIAEIELAFKMTQILNHKVPETFLFNIGDDDHRDLRIVSQTLICSYKTSNMIRQFYSADRILSLILNKNSDKLENQIMANFVHGENIIELSKTYDEQAIVLYVQKQATIQKQSVSWKQKDAKQSIKIRIPFQNCKEFYIVLSDSVIWNKCFSLKEQQQLLVKKQSPIVTINEEKIIQLKHNLIIDIQKFPIHLKIKQPKHSGIAMNMSQNPHNIKGIKLQLLSRNVCYISFKLSMSCKVEISYPNFTNYHFESSTTSLSYVSHDDINLANTKFLKIFYRNKMIDINSAQRQQQQSSRWYDFPEPLKQQKLDFTISKQENIDQMVYAVSHKDMKFLTRAGEERIDYIQLCDINGTPIKYDKPILGYFFHINKLDVIKAQIQVTDNMYGLKWKPKIRGKYRLYVNSVCLNTPYQIGVAASNADILSCQILVPQYKQICFSQKTEISVTLKDQFKNIYTQLQQSITGDPLLIQFQTNAQFKQHFKKEERPIDKYGTKKIFFQFDNSLATNGGECTVIISINAVQKAIFQMKVHGQILQQRKKKMQQQIETLLAKKKLLTYIEVSRTNFLQSLAKLGEKSLFEQFSVKFENEAGIDAGGLKRQFYDMIGNQFKSKRNKFFTEINTSKAQYFLNEQSLKNKSKLKYMELLGKLLANSILNQYLIGVNFSEVFIKMLYEMPVSTEDFFNSLPQKESRGYRSLLNTKAEDYEDLCLYFIAGNQGQIQLKQNGKNIAVTAENVGEYLHLLSKKLLVERYAQSIESFRTGFNSVIDINIIKKWIANTQFWCLTTGAKQITSQAILNYIHFDEAPQLYLGWFRRYISQCNRQILIGFLKFSSGSSTIDFSLAGKIVVTFYSDGSNPQRLPHAHTCWKQIKVPMYKTYEVMKKYLDTAFQYCSEGFGFG